jgi:hypothetical protein
VWQQQTSSSATTAPRNGAGASAVAGASAGAGAAAATPQSQKKRLLALAQQEAQAKREPHPEPHHYTVSFLPNFNILFSSLCISPVWCLGQNKRIAPLSFTSIHHHHQPINISTAGAQAFLTDYT